MCSSMSRCFLGVLAVDFFLFGNSLAFLECGGLHTLERNILYHVHHCVLVILTTFRECTDFDHWVAPIVYEFHQSNPIWLFPTAHTTIGCGRQGPRYSTERETSPGPPGPLDSKRPSETSRWTNRYQSVQLHSEEQWSERLVVVSPPSKGIPVWQLVPAGGRRRGIRALQTKCHDGQYNTPLRGNSPKA